MPTLYASLLAHPRIGPKAGSERLRRCISAGEALPEAVGQRWLDMVGVDILDGIGSTEMLHIFVSNRPDDVRYGTRGKPVPGYEARVLDEHGRPVPHGEAGELVVRGPSAADGYWNQRDKTRRTFRGEWTHTGDTYTRDAEGYYRYCGRSDEMLKVSGVWVSPFEVEEALVSPSGGAGGGRGRARRIGRADQAQGVRHVAGGGEAAGRGHGEGTAEDACEGAHRRVEIPALDRVRGRACRRPRPARSSASGCAKKTSPASTGEVAAKRRVRVPHAPRSHGLDCQRLETAWWGPAPTEAPTLVLLHEGLGCVALWRDVPALLADATGCGVFAYSRFGYGQSDPKPLPWPLTYMQDEARDVLPRVLDAAGIRRGILVGHSDGGSIAAVYAGNARDRAVARHRR